MPAPEIPPKNAANATADNASFTGIFPSLLGTLELPQTEMPQAELLQISSNRATESRVTGSPAQVKPDNPASD
jgi:hypothetical protein